MHGQVGNHEGGEGRLWAHAAHCSIWDLCLLCVNETRECVFVRVFELESMCAGKAPKDTASMCNVCTSLIAVIRGGTTGEVRAIHRHGMKHSARQGW